MRPCLRVSQVLKDHYFILKLLSFQGAMAGAGALMIHELNKGKIKTEERLVLESEALENDELLLDTEDAVFD